jgi:hypothetical protein
VVPVLVVDDAAEALQLDPSPHSKMPAGKRASLEPVSEGPSSQINQTLDLTANRGSDALVFNQLVAESLVIALNVVMLRIFAHGFAKVTLAQRNNLFEALRLDGANESLGVGVQIWAS